VVHSKNASALLVEGLTLDDPGAPQKPRLTAEQKMRAAREKPALVTSNNRWAQAYAMESATAAAWQALRCCLASGKTARSSAFADPVVRDVIETAAMPAPMDGDAGGDDDDDKDGAAAESL